MQQHPELNSSVSWQLERETSARVLRLQQSSSKAERREVLGLFFSLLLIISTFAAVAFMYRIFFFMLQHMVRCEDSSEGASFQARAAAAAPARHVLSTLTWFQSALLLAPQSGLIPAQIISTLLADRWESDRGHRGGVVQEHQLQPPSSAWSSPQGR